jgi:hypothetical protein
LWHFADEGSQALEWAMRERTDITTLRTFVRTLTVVLASAELVAEQRKNETAKIEDGGLMLIKLQ